MQPARVFGVHSFVSVLLAIVLGGVLWAENEERTPTRAEESVRDRVAALIQTVAAGDAGGPFQFIAISADRWRAAADAVNGDVMQMQKR